MRTHHLRLPRRAALVTALGACLWGGIVVSAVPCVAQDAPVVTLEDVLRMALERSARVQIARRDVDARDGQRIEAAEPFDTLVAGSLAGTRQNSFVAGTTLPSTRTESMVYGGAAQKRLRSGIIVAPQFQVTGASAFQHGSVDFGQAQVRVDVVVPLMKDRGGAISAAPARSAGYEREASALRLRHAQAETVLAAAAAYWEYLAARGRLDVFRSAEARAQRMVEETRELVAAEERTTADLTQVLGNLAAKRASRISAEQGVIDAWHQLAQTASLTIAEALTPRAPATPFPETSAAAPGRTLDQLVSQALMLRQDLAAAEREVQAARALVEGARSDLDDRLDLTLSGGYQGRMIGRGLDRLLSPFYRDVPGLDASAQVRYEVAPQRSGARGRFLQQEAVAESRRIAQADLSRQIAIQVPVAVAACEHGQASLEAARDAVEKLETTVQNEIRKFRLGMSTLFDVLLSEDSLTSARLTEIQGQQSHAVAIASLRFQTGALVQFQGKDPLVRVAALLTPQ